MRMISEDIVSFAELGLPQEIGDIARLPRGLVLVTGPTGSGKSTTLATMIDLINAEYPKHIVTIEDPIEFFHQHKTSIVNQREIGEDTTPLTMLCVACSGRRRTSSWSARCATTKPSGRRSPLPKPATW